MKLGTNDIGSVYLGTNAVQKVYLGTNEVWTSNSGLLADYPNAAAAYSLRLLQTAYTGSAIRVRRASDNTEQDIGFVNNELDTSTLTSFCSGTNGFVKTWYDQSGNGYDATQTTAASQPQIVSSGSVITKGGKPCIQISTSNVTGVISLQTNAFVSVISQPVTVFSAWNQETVDDRQALFDGRTNQFGMYYFLTDYQQTAGTSIFLSSTTTGQKLAYNLFDTTSSELSVNNSTLATGDNGSNQLDGITIGNLRGVPSPLVNNYMLIGQIHEMVFYNSDQSSNRTGIETNINANYQIYWDGSQTSLLDTYSGSAAAYSLRALSSAYTGPLVRVRRASDNAEQDIYAKYDGTLNVSALESFCSGTNGFVKTWYDQSGNGNDATQTTAANQPQIVSSGSVIVEGSKPSVEFDGTSSYLQAADNNSLSFTNGSGIDLPITAFATFKLTSTVGNRVLFGKDSGSPNREYAWGYFSEAESRFFLKDNGGNNQISRDNKNAGQLNLYQQSTMIYDASEVNTGIAFYSNGGAATMGDAVAGTYTGMANTSSPLTVGTYLSSTAYFQGIIQELILYPSDQSTNRTGIETNINTYYSIY